MPTQYYINRNDKVLGPFSEGRIRSLYAEGKLRDEDLVRTGDEGDWKPLSTILSTSAPRRQNQRTRSAAEMRARTPLRIAVAAGFLLLAGFSGWLVMRKSTKPATVVNATSEATLISVPSKPAKEVAAEPNKTTQKIDEGFAALLGESDEWEWGPAEILSGVGGAGFHNATPEVSMNGLTMVIASNRSGGLGDHDLLVSRRKNVNSPWPALSNPGASVNCSAVDWSPTLSADGQVLYFHTGRVPSLAGDIWHSVWDEQSQQWNTAVRLAESLNRERTEQMPLISPDDLELIVWSNSSDSISSGELWQYRRDHSSLPFGEGSKLRSKHSSLAALELANAFFYSPDALSIVFSVRSNPVSFVMCTRTSPTSEWENVRSITLLPQDARDISYSSAAGLMLLDRNNVVWKMQLLPKGVSLTNHSVTTPLSSERPNNTFDVSTVVHSADNKNALNANATTHTIGSVVGEIQATEWLNTNSPLSLESLRGQIVLVEFWATWCGPCVAGIPHLNEMQKKYGDKGFRILSLTAEDRETVEAFQKTREEPIEYTVGLGSSTSDKYGVRGIPAAFLIDTDGKLVWNGHPSSPQCEEAIAKALGTKPPSAVTQPSTEINRDLADAAQADFSCQQVIAERDSRPDYGPLKTEMNRRIRNLRSLLTEAGVPEALIVAGKIELPETEAGNVDASIAMQCEVFSDGHFVTALGEVTRPLFVVANGYLPTEIRIPAGTEVTNNVIHISPITLQPVTQSTEGVIYGNISLRPPGPMSQIHLSFQPLIESRFNLPDALKSIETLPALNPSFLAHEAGVLRDGTFQKTGVSPMPHRVLARCFGYEIGECTFDGKKLKPENLFLEAVPKYLLEILHANEKSSDHKSVALVSQSSSILDGKWFQISRGSPKEVGATTLIIEPSRRGLQWAALDSSSLEKPWKQASSLTMVEFTKEEVIEIGRSYVIRGTENKDDRIIFTLTAPPAVEVAKSIQEIAVGKLPAQFRSQNVDKLESDLQQVRQVPRETSFGLAGLVTAGGTALQSGAVAISLHSSGATSLIRSEGIDGAIAFAATSPSQVRGGASAVLSVRAFGYEPIEEELPITSGKLLCIEIALKPIAIESQSQLELNVVDIAGKPVPLTEVTLSFVGASPVWTGSGGLAGFSEMTWTQKTDRLGKVVFPGLSSDWYKFVVRHKSLRPAVRTLFLESSQQSVQTVPLRPRRMVRIEFVAQPDGTGKFTADAINAEIQEGSNIPLEKNADTYGQMTLSQIDLHFGFTHSGCWIVDVGKQSLGDVTDALTHKPKQGVSGFANQNATRAQCRIGHVYVVETPSKQHIKFRVTEIVEPKP